MTEWMVPFLGGILLGGLYFVGLWWTVGRLESTDHPVSLYLLSFGFRIAALMLAFYFLLSLGVLSLLVALFGFMVTRFALVRCLGLAPQRNRIAPDTRVRIPSGQVPSDG